MFHLFYKQLFDLPSDERFITAIVKSSEDHLPVTPEREPLIMEWYKQYRKKGKKVKNG